MTAIERKCALNNCSNTADKWTMCDQCADSMGIHVPYGGITEAAEGPHTPHLRPLTTEEHQAIMKALKTYLVKDVAHAIGLADRTFRNMRQQGPGYMINATYAGRALEDWMQAGCPVTRTNTPERRHPGRRMVPLPEEHRELVLDGMAKAPTKTLGRVIGLSATSMTRIRDSEPGLLVRPHVAERIATWVINGADVPVPEPKPVVERPRIEQHHMDAVRAAVNKWVTFSAAAADMNMSHSTFRRFFREKKVGDIMAPDTLAKVEDWAAKNPDVPAPENRVAYDRELLPREWSEAVVEAVRTTGPARRVAKGIGINGDTVRRIVNDPEGVVVRLSVRKKLAAWMDAGCPVPEWRVRVSLRDQVALEPHHVELVQDTIRVLGSVNAAALHTGIKWDLMHGLAVKKVGHTTTLGTLRKLERWGEVLGKLERWLVDRHEGVSRAA